MLHPRRSIYASAAILAWAGMCRCASAQEAWLLPSNAQSGALTGCSVAISDRYAIVGARYYDGTAVNEGAAWVFERNGTTWTEKLKLQPVGGAGWLGNFGQVVRLEGERAVVSSQYTFASGIQFGGLWVFDRGDGSWAQSAYLYPSDHAPTQHFGETCAVSGDTILVGSKYDNGGAGPGSYRGAVYAFERIGGVWQQTAKFYSPEPANDQYFGHAVSVSGDHAIVCSLVAAPGSRAYTFRRVGGSWVSTGKLSAGGNEWFTKASVHGDRVAATGGPTAIPGMQAVNVFDYDGVGWVHQATLNSTNQFAGDGFGIRVRLLGDRIAIGAVALPPRRTYVFDRIEGAWTQTHVLDLPTEYASEGLDAYGERYVVGDPTLVPAGGARVFQVPTLTANTSTISASTGGSQALRLNTETPSFAGKLRFVLGSASGTQPGLAAGPYTLPLNLDGYLMFTLGSPNQPPLSGGLGWLDGSGAGLATFSLPAGADPALIGLIANHAFVVIDPATLGIEWASNAVFVRIVP